MSVERELLEELATKDMVSYYYPELIKRIIEIIAQPELGLTPREGIPFYKQGYKRGYTAAVMDLKQKVDSVFNLIMEDDDE